MYLFYWLMMYLFLWDVYVRGRHYFFISIIVSCFTCATLITDLYYELFMIYVFYFLFYEIKILFYFYLYSVELLSTLATDR